MIVSLMYFNSQALGTTAMVAFVVVIHPKRQNSKRSLGLRLEDHTPALNQRCEQAGWSSSAKTTSLSSNVCSGDPLQPRLVPNRSSVAYKPHPLAVDLFLSFPLGISMSPIPSPPAGRANAGHLSAVSPVRSQLLLFPFCIHLRLLVGRQPHVAMSVSGSPFVLPRSLSVAQSYCWLIDRDDPGLQSPSEPADDCVCTP